MTGTLFRKDDRVSGLYIILTLIGVLALLLAGPLLFRRMFLPKMTLALVKRWGKWVAKLLDRIKPDLDLKLLVEALNKYWAKKYTATPKAQRALFLPICLRPKECPGQIDPQKGVLCVDDPVCGECTLGRLTREAQELGYGQVYIVPSSRLMPKLNLPSSSVFIKDKLSSESIEAALGVVCGWHLRNRLLTEHKVGSGGYESGRSGKTKAVLQGVLLDQRKCRGGTVNWDEVREKLKL